MGIFFSAVDLLLLLFGCFDVGRVALRGAVLLCLFPLPPAPLSRPSAERRDVESEEEMERGTEKGNESSAGAPSRLSRAQERCDSLQCRCIRKL